MRTKLFYTKRDLWKSKIGFEGKCLNFVTV